MSDAIPYETIVERVKDDIDYIAGSAYGKGYNTAKSEIALSGEYERAYMRGKKDAVRWIPCSERLPDEKKEVLISADGDLYIAEYEMYHSKEYWSEVIEYRNVTDVDAWMPLPEPYRGEQE